MFFDFFKKKDSSKEEPKEKIRVIGDDGKEIVVEKTLWLKEVFYPYLNEHENDVVETCDMIQTALEYGVNYETVEPSIKIYNKNKDSAKAITNLFECYMKNNMYSEAAKLYKEHIEEGKPVTYGMYYNLAIALEHLRDFDGMEKYLFMSFVSNNNSNKAIIKLMEYMKENSTDYYGWLKDIEENSKSWYLSKELALLQYEKGMSDEATNTLLKALEYCGKIEKNVYVIGKILKNNKRYIDFENQIVPLYNPETTDVNMHLLILDFYVEEQDFVNGLKLLSELYTLNKYNDRFVEYEKAFLKMKLLNNNPYKASCMFKNEKYGTQKIQLLKKPLYSIVFGTEYPKRESKSLVILPFYVKQDGSKYPEKVRNFVKNASTYLEDNIYISTNLDVKSLMFYDDLGVRAKDVEYDQEYLTALKQANPSISSALTGEILEMSESNKSFELKIYKYDLETMNKIDIFMSEASLETLYEIFTKFFNSAIRNNFSSDVKELKLYDKNFMEYYSDYVEILLGVNGYNKFKLFTTDRIIKYCLQNSNEYKINLALSLLKIQSETAPQILKRYKQRVWESISVNDMSKEIIDNFEKVYGDKDAKEQN